MNQCIICKSKGPAWLLLNNDNLYVDINKNKIGETIQTCSYLCTQKCKNHLPNDYGRLILNKEDFKYDLIPFIKKKEEKFELLTFEEIQNMDEIEKNKYYENREKRFVIDSRLLEFYEELEKEDKKTFYIEEEYENLSSEEDYDDY